MEMIVATDTQTHASEAKSLRNIFARHTGKVTDKWEHYLSVYEAELALFCAEGRPVRLLEVGVQNGGSLEVWHKFLPEGSTCLGLDIDPRVAALVYDTDRIATYVCDAADRELLESAIGDQSFDIIIDDGSHRCADVVTSFDILFNHLAPCGKYFIEDLHCSYCAAFGGGLLKKDSSVEFFKGFIDALNFDHVAPAERIASDRRDYMLALNRWIARLAFYDSVLVLEKLGAPKERPYRRALSGLDGQLVAVSPLLVTGEIGSGALLGEPLARQVEERLLIELKNLRTSSSELSAAIERTESEKSAMAQALCEAKQRSITLEARVSELADALAKSNARVAELEACRADDATQASYQEQQSGETM
jgi:hypothetical protein